MGHQDWAESLCYHVAKDALEAAKHAAEQPAGDEAEFARKKAVATVIVFSATCLEAFINRQALERLSPSDLQSFMGKALRQKWLESPKMLNPSSTGFDTAAEPYSTFAKLVLFRNNRLVHFKPAQESSSSIPANWDHWAEEIGNVRLAERYFQCVREMVDALHRLTGRQTSPATILDQEYVRTVTATLGINSESR